MVSVLLIPAYVTKYWPLPLSDKYYFLTLTLNYLQTVGKVIYESATEKNFDLPVIYGRRKYLDDSGKLRLRQDFSYGYVAAEPTNHEENMDNYESEKIKMIKNMIQDNDIAWELDKSEGRDINGRFFTQCWFTGYWGFPSDYLLLGYNVQERKFLFKKYSTTKTCFLGHPVDYYTMLSFYLLSVKRGNKIIFTATFDNFNLILNLWA